MTIKFIGIIGKMLTEAKKQAIETYKNSSVHIGIGIDNLETETLKEAPFIFYADTLKSTGDLKVYPLTFEKIDLEEEEKRMDNFLFDHFSISKNSKQHWPRMHTTIDPNSNQVYKLIEFPVVIGKDVVLSIKQSVRENGKLVSLAYRLAIM